MIARLLWVLCLTCLAAAAAAGAQTANCKDGYCIGLVVANADYQQPGWRKLANPPRDQQLVTNTLTRMRFRTGVLNDVSPASLLSGIDAMAIAAKQKGDPAKAVLLVYVAGHGQAIDGRNQLIMPKADPDGNDKVDLDALIERLRRTEAGRILLFIDACRNDGVGPSPGGGRGVGSAAARNVGFLALNKERLPRQLYISFSTLAGMAASDGQEGGFSPFAQAFSEVMPNAAPLTTVLSHLGDYTALYASNSRLPPQQAVSYHVTDPGQLVPIDNFALLSIADTGEESMLPIRLPAGYKFQPDDATIRVVKVQDYGGATFELVPSPRLAGIPLTYSAQSEKGPLDFREETVRKPDGSIESTLRAAGLIAGQATYADSFIDRIQTIFATDGQNSGKIQSFDLAKLVIDHIRPQLKNADNEFECTPFSCKIGAGMKYRLLNSAIFVSSRSDMKNFVEMKAREYFFDGSGRGFPLQPGTFHYQRLFLDGTRGLVKSITMNNPKYWINIQGVNTKEPAYLWIKMDEYGRIKIESILIFDEINHCLVDAIWTIGGTGEYWGHDEVGLCEKVSIEADIDGGGPTSDWRKLTLSGNTLVFGHGNRRFSFRFDVAAALAARLADEEPAVANLSCSGRLCHAGEQRSGEDCSKRISLRCLMLWQTFDRLEVSLDGSSVFKTIDFAEWRRVAGQVLTGKPADSLPEQVIIDLERAPQYYWRAVAKGTAGRWNRVVR